VQEASDIEKAVEQMMAAVRTISVSITSTPLPSSAIDQLRHIYQQIETFITTD